MASARNDNIALASSDGMNGENDEEDPVTIMSAAVCNRQYACMSSAASIPLRPVSYTHLTLPTNREV